MMAVATATSSTKIRIMQTTLHVDPAVNICPNVIPAGVVVDDDVVVVDDDDDGGTVVVVVVDGGTVVVVVVDGGTVVVVVVDVCGLQISLMDFVEFSVRNLFMHLVAISHTLVLDRFWFNA
jgi:hypothetical protein